MVYQVYMMYESGPFRQTGGLPLGFSHPIDAAKPFMAMLVRHLWPHRLDGLLEFPSQE
jgi:hypothetical protein